MNMYLHTKKNHKTYILDLVICASCVTITQQCLLIKYSFTISQYGLKAESGVTNTHGIRFEN